MNLLTNYHTYYRGEDCMKVLSQKLLEIAKEITSEEKHDMNPLTNNEENQYQNSEKCHICEKPFLPDKKDKYYKKLRKVKDHCHYTGKYRGAAHSLCNSRYQEQRSIPAILYNGSNYDFHLLIKELAKEFKSNMRCIGENTEKYISISVNFQEEKEEEEDSFKKIKTYRL